MKSRTRTWEVIIAGCLLTALSVYLMMPAQTAVPIQHTSQAIQWEVPTPPEAPSVPKSLTAELQKLEQELKQLEQLKELEELKKIEEELKKVEKELESTSIELERMSLPSLKGLPQILIYPN